ncbi:MAG: hypothetical protein K9H34_05140 [Actinomycetia bacterium]|nr:hypothetical protein [Actinomycetes bacterium]
MNHQLPSIAFKRLHRTRALRAMTVVLLSFVVSVSVLVSFAGTASAASCSGPISDGEIRVVLVVDSSDLGGSSSATCLVVPAGTTGSQLLARRGNELGIGSPRYGSSGLLCAIDGLPATGCGDRNSGGYGYWAYFFDGGGNWTYGSNNPFSKRLTDGAIEGWRFVTGGCGCGQDPSPRIGPSRSLFPALAPARAPLPELPTASAPSSPSSNPSSTNAGGSSALIPPSSGDANPEQLVGAATGSSTVTSAAEAVVVGEVALASSNSTDSNAGRWVGIAVVFVLIGVMAGGAWVQTRGSR